MLSYAAGDLLTYAVAVAIGPTPVVGVVLCLAASDGRVRGGLFALGWLLGLVVMSVPVVWLAIGAGDPSSLKWTLVALVKLTVGAVFLAAAAYLALARRRMRAPGHDPLGRVDAVGRWGVLGAGTFLSGANPKNLALVLAASVSIAEWGLDAGAQALAVGAFAMVGSVTVLVPVLWFWVAGPRAVGVLEGACSLVTQHKVAILLVILVLLGVKLLGDGLAKLAG